ncbi:hypothetical protein [Pseudonocardia endophytica]|uniref:Uncharacterized protein n=1 Tax=Pseudonocardia endophytica TaxID=401976 RepID=A0A4R1HSN7_PSEEN|nr:hypothetical protein [Pseudonocardia endophytica]TCK22869.1 hypothetical protein EV378_6880 [Pseudonocardia endophytica]
MDPQNVLTTAGTVLCGHGAPPPAAPVTGRVALGDGAGMLRVRLPGVTGTAATAHPVLVTDDVVPRVVDGCPRKDVSPPTPCLTVQSVTPGSTSAVLRAGGAPVLLAGLDGVTEGQPTLSLQVTAGQSVLRAV